MAGENETVGATEELADDDRSGSTLSPAAGQAVGGEQSSPAAPAGQATPTAPADPAQPAAPAAPAAPLSAREWAAQQLGYQQATQYPDDMAFLRAMYAGQQTAQQAQRRVQELETERAYLMQQAARPQQPPPGPADPLAALKAPEFDARWLSQVEQDENGNLKPKAGVDPTIVPKLMAYQQHQRKLFEQFTSDPAAFLKPMIESQAQAIAQKVAQEQFQQYQAKSYQDNFLASNSKWLFAHDSAGNPLQNPVTGKYVPTKEGLAFTKYVFEAEAAGITGAQAQEKYAQALLMRDLAAPLLQQQQAGQ